MKKVHTHILTDTLEKNEMEEKKHQGHLLVKTKELEKN